MSSLIRDIKERVSIPGLGAASARHIEAFFAAHPQLTERARALVVVDAPEDGVIVFFLQIDTLPQKNSSRDKHLQNRLSETPCAFGAD